MWAAILGILDKVLGLFKSKSEQAAKKAEIVNQKEFKEAKVKQDAIKVQDRHEKLTQLVHSDDIEVRSAALEEIRKRLGKS